MKAEELMIGDWVTVFDYPPQDGRRFIPRPEAGTFMKVVSISTKESNGRTDYILTNHFDEGIRVSVQLSLCYGIKLTPEILEKNSFLEVESIEYPSHSVGISFLYRNTPEGLRIFVQNACAGGPTCTMIKTCKYVHEVQHMIKMCDIEKEIVL